MCWAGCPGGQNSSLVVCWAGCPGGQNSSVGSVLGWLSCLMGVRIAQLVVCWAGCAA